MSSSERTTFLDNQDREDDITCCKGTTIVILVLLFCGVLALLISAGIYFYDIRQQSGVLDTSFLTDSPVTTTPTISTITTSRPSSCEKRIVGYFNESEPGDITKIQLSKLTHALFQNVELSWEGVLKFRSARSRDIFLSLKNEANHLNSDLKVMIAIGGDGNSHNFASVTGESRKKATFINSIIEFLEEHKIDGVDFYWKDATKSNRWNYINFVRELRQKLRTVSSKNYLISLTIPPPTSSYSNTAYDLEESLKDVDFFNVWSMDYQGPWENEWGTPAGPIAQLYSTTEGRKQFSVDSTMKYYVCKTMQPSKFNIAIPFFARLWRNVEGSLEHGKEAIRNVQLINNKAVGNAYMSRWTVEDQKLNLTSATWDKETRSSYVFDVERKTYLTFEDEKSIAAKVDYVNSMNLGGVWIYKVEMDDDQNSLLKMLATKELCSIKSGSYVRYNC